MTAPSLDPNGLIDASDSFFFEWMLRQSFLDFGKRLDGEVSGQTLFNFKMGTAILAREVRALKYDWEHAVQVCSSVAGKMALTEEAVACALEEAWRWSDAGIHHWSDLVRHWVFDWQFDEFVHLQTGERLSLSDFHALFQVLSPHEEHAITRFLIESGWVIAVDAVHEKGAQHGFSGPEHALELTLAH